MKETNSLKRALKLLLIVFAATAMLVAFPGCASETEQTGSNGNNGQDERTFELKLAHFFPGTHPAETELVAKWGEAIEEATDGRVTITSYPGQTLLNAPDIYDGVVGGVAELGLSCFSYTRGRFPLLEAFELPGITYNNSRVASKVAWEGIQELQPEEVKDTKLMMVFATGPGDLFTKVPVRTLEDLQGLEIRATGLSAQTLRVLGAAPDAMAQSEAYEALSRGVVQGNLSPIEVLQGWGHAEVTDYLTLTPFLYNNLFFITMNLEQWNALPSDVQDIILDVNDDFMENVAQGLWDKQNESALEWAVNQQGIELIELSPEETQRWIDIVMELQQDYIDKMEDLGLDGEKALETVKELADQYNAEY